MSGTVDAILAFAVVDLEPGAEVRLTAMPRKQLNCVSFETDEAGRRALGVVQVVQGVFTRYHDSEFPALAEMNARQKSAWDQMFQDAPPLGINEPIAVEVVNVSKERVQVVLLVRGTEVAS